MRALVFDTETTGLPLWKEPSEHPGQPHLVQYTGVVVDTDTAEESDYVDTLVRPDGWIIPDEVSAIHGITTERALAEGVPEADVVRGWHDLLPTVDLVVGFNVDFDLRLMRIGLVRYGWTKEQCDEIAKAIRKHDVMRQVTPIAKLPPTNRMMAAGMRQFKQPTLKEAMLAVFGETMEDAHDARGDVLATLRLFMHLNHGG